jgi:hypothetical protein
MTSKISLVELTIAFDNLRFSEQGLPVDRGVIIQRPVGRTDRIVIRIESGIAAGSEAFADTEDFPGIGHERAIFSARARVGESISFRLHVITAAGIRVRPLPLE